MVLTYTDDFKVEWKDPADAALTWTMDAMHFGRPLPALSSDVLSTVLQDVFGARVAIVNGYSFMHNMSPPMPTPEVIQRGAAEIWENDYVHRVREAAAKMRSADYDSMSAEELAQALPGIAREGLEAFRYTMVVVFGFMMPTMQLMDFCEQELGAEGPQLLAVMLQGFENESAAAGAGLASLAETAARTPAVAAALRAGNYAGLRGVPGGSEFMAEFDQYLHDYGWRAESWSLAHVPTWIEQPELPLMLISRYISDPERSPSVAIARASVQRKEAEGDMRSRLSGEKLAQFDTMLAASQKHVSVSESRALWQLIIVGSMRVPFLAMGRKLVSSGALDQPDDVFYLSMEEIKAAAGKPDSGLKPVIAWRRAELERQQTLTPPPFLGSPPSPEGMPKEMGAVMMRFFGIGLPPSLEPDLLKGHAASKGVYRGRARIIHELRDAERLQPGDVLVCQSTAPPWTPLFAIAGAVVTDTGGILSHSAICAREYAIPCVVGTTTATRQIPDGAMVTVDGGAGTVTIER